MPELPEIETLKNGLLRAQPALTGQKVKTLEIRDARLRWPIDSRLPALLQGAELLSINRRAKYLLMDFQLASGHQHGLILHLGMSGSVRLEKEGAQGRKHDRFRVLFPTSQQLVMHDPRRFGFLIHCSGEAREHPRLQHLGPEPLAEEFNGRWLWSSTQGSRRAIKTWLMDSKCVAGVGNIYANEALHLAGIHPERVASSISKKRMDKLAQAVQKILREAISQGGTTLRDFHGLDGEKGYFSLRTRVYGRADEPCLNCGAALRLIRQAQRASVYCPRCQR